MVLSLCSPIVSPFSFFRAPDGRNADASTNNRLLPFSRRRENFRKFSDVMFSEGLRERGKRRHCEQLRIRKRESKSERELKKYVVVRLGLTADEKGAIKGRAAAASKVTTKGGKSL